VRCADIFRIALSALFQQKVRTFLTMAGVVIGTLALVVCLSLGRGFEREVMRQFNHSSLSRQIMVSPGSGVREADIPQKRLEIHGRMSPAKRQRLRQAIIHRWPDNSRGIRLDRARVTELARIPHVKSVLPFVKKRCQVALEGQRQREVTCFAANADNAHFRNRIVAGSYFTEDTDQSVVVSEYLLYRWGFRSDEAVVNAVDQKLCIEYHPETQLPSTLRDLIRSARLNLAPEQRKVVDKTVGELDLLARPVGILPFRRQIGALVAAVPWGPLPLLTAMHIPPDISPFRMQIGALTAAVPWGPLPLLTALHIPPQTPPWFRKKFKIVGVLREFIEDQDVNDVFDLGAGTRSINADVFLPARTAEGLFSQGPEHDLLGFSGVILTVDQESNTKEVARKVQSQGLQEYSLVEFVQAVRTNLVLGTFVTAFLAAVALLVAALGITNTMIMTVLERTREIGVMKAVGARDGHIQMIFLLEGALIGLFGGTLGVLCGWIASFPGDAIARSLLQDQSLPPVSNTLFVFPLWLTLGTPLFAGLVTTLAAVYPARRATRVNPIMALRHE
jgi:putative ABC transport system permease protein